jgi:hypothetical protein
MVKTFIPCPAEAGRFFMRIHLRRLRPVAATSDLNHQIGGRKLSDQTQVLRV